MAKQPNTQMELLEFNTYEELEKYIDSGEPDIDPQFIFEDYCWKYLIALGYYNIFRWLTVPEKWKLLLNPPYGEYCGVDLICWADQQADRPILVRCIYKKEKETYEEMIKQIYCVDSKSYIRFAFTNIDEDKYGKMLSSNYNFIIFRRQLCSAYLPNTIHSASEWDYQYWKLNMYVQAKNKFPSKKETLTFFDGNSICMIRIGAFCYANMYHFKLSLYQKLRMRALFNLENTEEKSQYAFKIWSENYEILKQYFARTGNCSTNQNVIMNKVYAFVNIYDGNIIFIDASIDKDSFEKYSRALDHIRYDLGLWFSKNKNNFDRWKKTKPKIRKDVLQKSLLIDQLMIDQQM